MNENLKSLSDDIVENQIQSLVAQEKATTLQILRYLREIERRQIFAKRGFSSLWDYCIQTLGYSESQAQRRIAAMRLIREIPEAEIQVKEGKITLAALAQAQTFFSQEKKQTGFVRTRDQKVSVLQKLEFKTKRENEKLLADICPKLIAIKESERPLGTGNYEIKLVLNNK
jgi:hypothetical protein